MNHYLEEIQDSGIFLKEGSKKIRKFSLKKS